MHETDLHGKRLKEKYNSCKCVVCRAAANSIDCDFSMTVPMEKWTTDVSQCSLPWNKCCILPLNAFRIFMVWCCVLIRGHNVSTQCTERS